MGTLAGCLWDLTVILCDAVQNMDTPFFLHPVITIPLNADETSPTNCFAYPHLCVLCYTYHACCGTLLLNMTLAISNIFNIL
jgi:hypothetical protein